MQKLTNELATILERADSRTLAKWWCALNRWDWPTELGEPEPEDAPQPNRRTLIMDEIMGVIGIKECLREWNKDRMPGQAFDDWYYSRRNKMARGD